MFICAFRIENATQVCCLSARLGGLLCLDVPIRLYKYTTILINYIQFFRKIIYPIFTTSRKRSIVHLLHIAYAHFKAHFLVHFRFFGNNFRRCGNLNSLFAKPYTIFAVGSNSASHNTNIL